MYVYFVTKDGAPVAGFVDEAQTSIFLHRQRGLCEAEDEVTFDFKVTKFQGDFIVSCVSGEEFLSNLYQ